MQELLIPFRTLQFDSLFPITRPHGATLLFIIAVLHYTGNLYIQLIINKYNEKEQTRPHASGPPL